MMRRISLSLLICIVVLSLVSCDLNTTPQTSPTTQESDPLSFPITETGSEEARIQSPIVGTWHYEVASQDCYIAFYEDGTGWLHYYQYYGPGVSINAYVNKGIRRWSYNPETQSLGITIAGSDLGIGINTDESFVYKVSELTADTLVIKKNGAYYPSVPINKRLSLGQNQNLPHI